MQELTAFILSGTDRLCSNVPGRSAERVLNAANNLLDVFADITSRSLFAPPIDDLQRLMAEKDRFDHVCRRERKELR
jgi:hypothetical protein